MYQVMVLEDDSAQADALCERVAASALGDRCAITALADLAAAENHLAAGAACDIAFIDIRLGEDEPDGIEFVKRHFPPGSGTQVIYVTGFVEEYCTPVYETDHVYFLKKPLVQADFDAALAKTAANLKLSESEPVTVSFGSEEHILLPEKIRYVESHRRKLTIHTESGNVMTYLTLTDLQERLPASFLRCHKSFLVNMAYIESLQARAIVLKNGEEIPVSQQRRAGVREALARYARSLV